MKQQVNKFYTQGRITIIFAFIILTAVGLLVLPMSSKTSSKSIERQNIQLMEGGRLGVRLTDGQELTALYAGQSESKNLIASGEASPKTLAAADFDEDGSPDLISGYGTGRGGVITLHRGNKSYRQNLDNLSAEQTQSATSAAFLSQAETFELPQSPDFIGTGDFDNDGHQDVVATALNGDALLLLPGNGRGGFGVVEPIPLPGRVTTITVGEMNRADHIADIGVAIVGDNGSQVLVFESPEGALTTREKRIKKFFDAAQAQPPDIATITDGRKFLGYRPVLTVVPSLTAEPDNPTSPYYSPADVPAYPEPEVFAMPAQVNALVMGCLNGDSKYDLAAAAGEELLIVSGRDRKLMLTQAARADVPEAKIERFRLGFGIEAMAIGNFVWNRQYRASLALLSDSGEVHLLTPGGIAPEPWSESEKRQRETFVKRLEKFEAKLRKNGKAGAEGVLARQSVINAERQRVYNQLKSAGLLPGVTPAELPADARTDWQITESLAVVSEQEARILSQAGRRGITRLAVGRISGKNADDLIVLDEAEQQMHIVGWDSPNRNSQIAGQAAKGKQPFARLAKLDTVNAPVAALAMHLNNDAVSDLVVLRQGASAPSTITTAPMMTFTVKSTSDTSNGSCGANCTLRDAINAANANPGDDMIVFDIGSGTPSITLTSNLPEITDVVTINGNTGGATRVEIIDNGATAQVFKIIVNNCAVRSLVLRVTEGDGIAFQENGGCAVTGCIMTGIATSNSEGVRLSNTTYTVIGGYTAADRNVISGFDGSVLSLFDAHAVQVIGNYIGTNETATAAYELGQETSGIYHIFAEGMEVGGTAPGAGNVIWGDGVGVSVGDNGFIEGNLIGTDITGTKILSRASDLGAAGGTQAFGEPPAIGGSAPMARNLISGVITGVSATPAYVVNNFIGTDITGTKVLGEPLGPQGNLKFGVIVYPRGVTTIGSNLISGNGVAGVFLKVAGKVTTAGNLIGTDITGAQAINNGHGWASNCEENPDGSCGSSDPGVDEVVIGGLGLARNIISGNHGDGIRNFQKTKNIRVENNYVGVDITGANPLGNWGRGIRAGGVTARIVNNLVSANNFQGMYLGSGAFGASSTFDQVAEGNKVGTNAAGTAALGNGSDGVDYGGFNLLINNLISGNRGHGVRSLTNLGTLIQSNRIGTDITGVNPLPNTGDGIHIYRETIDLVLSNTIAFNNGRGVRVDTSDKVRILGNSIFSNGAEGISLYNSNNNQPAPVLTSVMVSGGSLTVSGTLNAPAGNYKLEFFSNDECDPSGSGEGKTLIGSMQFNKTGSGQESFTASGLLMSVLQENIITATSTSVGGEVNGESSQFSNCLPLCTFTLSCPSNITTGTDAGQCSAQVSFTPTASASCIDGITYEVIPTCTAGGVTITSPHTFPAGTTTVTCSAGPEQCSFTVTVNDDDGPIVTVPPDIVADALPDQCSASVSYTVSANDACSGPVPLVICTVNYAIITSPYVFPKGTTTVTCDALDAGNRRSSASFTVTVRDRVAPVVTVPANIVQSTDAGQCSASVSFAASATDNCDAVTLVCKVGDTAITSPHVFPKGITTVTCSTSDTSSNSASAAFTVTVNDSLAPTVTVPANITQATDANQCSASIGFSVSANDDCDGALTPVCKVGDTPITSPYSFPKGVTTVTCTASDASSNTGTNSFTVTINDTQAPAISCANVAAQSANADANCAAPVPDVRNLVRAQSSDNCTAGVDLVVTQSPAQGSLVSGTGSHPIMVTVTDASNNSATCVVAFTLIDTTLPVVLCPANIVKVTEPNLCSAVATFSATASDNCSGVGTPVCTPPSGTTFPTGTTMITCTVRDAANNQSTPCWFTVTVMDTQPPSITCPANQTSVTVNPGNSTVTVTYPSPTAADNCGLASVVCNPPSGSAFPLGVTTVTCTAMDVAGNTTTCSFTVTTFDVCVQDDSVSSRVLLWNSVTGDYRLCSSGAIVTGKGTLSRQSNLFKLTHNAADRRLMAQVDVGAARGSASLQMPVGIIYCTITDRDLRNNSCLCQ
ncbi:MAG: HYR domain-containing protein [Acidobacteriota bacterium]